MSDGHRFQTRSRCGWAVPPLLRKSPQSEGRCAPILGLSSFDPSSCQCGTFAGDSAGGAACYLPPTDSPLHAWLTTGDPETYRGPLVISWVFFKDMTLRDEGGQFLYSPLFFARVVSQGQPPFVIQMTSAWHERANTTMALPARGRSVHHLPARLVQVSLKARGHFVHRPFPGWDFELLTMEVVLHTHCLRASRALLGGALLGSTTSLDLSQQDFGTPPPTDLGGR